MREFAGEARFAFPSQARSTFPRKSRLPAALLCMAALLASTNAAALCVRASEANLRQGPGTQYAKSWEVFKYMPFKASGKKGAWYRVKDVDGDTHWIHQNLVSRSTRCAVVTAETARVRSGPGTRHAQTAISPVSKYYAFKVLSTQGKWARVEDELKNRGWVATSLLWIQ